MVGMAQASAVITPTAVMASSSYPLAYRQAELTISDSGMSFDGSTTAANLHTYTYTRSFNEFWHANEAPAGVYIEFDLGGDYTLETMVVWNYQPLASYPGEVSRGFKQFDMVLLDSGGGTIATFNDIIIAQAVAQNFMPGEIVDFADTAGVRKVRLELDSNYDGSNYAGLTRVRFTGVPEPGSMVLLGLGGMMALGRRRR